MATVLNADKKPIRLSDALSEASHFDLLHKKGKVSAGAMGRLFKTIEGAFTAAKAAAMSNPALAGIITSRIDIATKIVPPRNTVAYATSDLEADDNKPAAKPKRGKTLFAQAASAAKAVKNVVAPAPDMHKRARRLMGMEPKKA